MALRSLCCCVLAWLLAAAAARADTAPFDLAGPGLKVSVTRNGATLPIDEVPNLAPGDQLSISADLPPREAVHYLLVAAFLRGADNPPPRGWFYRAETWTRQGESGLKIAVPAGASQAVVFLAPQTGGDFRAIVNAVRGRPGEFVRAAQDLREAALQHSRLDAFLAVIRKRDQADPDQLKKLSAMLARSLSIKLDQDCFQKAPEVQAACLTQSQGSVLISDGRTTSLVQALTSGSSADLALQLSATPQAHFGYFNPYIGAIMDFARIMDSMHTANFQYIPALPTAKGDRLDLLLNSPPSFHNPLSVLVTALPPVEPPQPPGLQAVDGDKAYCAQSPELVLPVEGAPLAYSTGYLHDVMLRLKDTQGRTIDLPAQADAEKGGFVVDTHALGPAKLGETVDGSLRGFWGFDAYAGPVFRLEDSGADDWRLAGDDDQGLVVGRDDTVRLEGAAPACVKEVKLLNASGETQTLSWEAEKSGRIAVVLPLAKAEPGPKTLLVWRDGAKEPSAIALKTFAQGAHVASLTVYAGDLEGVLKGTRLDEVASVALGSVELKPGALTTSGHADELTLTAAQAKGAGGLKPGQSLIAKVALKDGRTLKLPVVIAPPRPSAILIGKAVQPAASAAPVALQLSDPDELPQGAQLTFSVQAKAPTKFSKGVAIEVATGDGAASVTLNEAGGLTLEDPTIAVATLDTRAFGGSAYGGLKFRVVEDGGAGDWQPLATLVRLPAVQDLKCAAGASHGCVLLGSRLFLIDSVSNEPGFAQAVKVPAGFPGYELQTPRPKGGRLYVKLHDDPEVVNLVTFPSKGAGVQARAETARAASGD